VRGVATGLVLEANVRRQVFVFFLAITLAAWLGLSAVQFAIVVVVSAAVISMELLNSALEALADAVHPDYDERIQRVKDMAAGAVLIVSVTALMIGISIFLFPLLDRLGQLGVLMPL